MAQMTDTAAQTGGNGGNIRLLYVHEDIMGNTRYHTKDNGQSYAELEYDVWGNPTSPNMLLNNDNGVFITAIFTGHIYDTVLDIYFAEARFLDAKNRQWLSSDPMKDGLNWYLYVGANPATFVDPWGLKVYLLGVSVSVSMGGSVGVDMYIFYDDKGNVGFVRVDGAGAGFFGASATGGIGVLDVDTIYDLSDVAVTFTGSAGALIIGSFSQLLYGDGTSAGWSAGFGFSFGSPLDFDSKIYSQSKIFNLAQTYADFENAIKNYIIEYFFRLWSC